MARTLLAKKKLLKHASPHNKRLYSIVEVTTTYKALFRSGVRTYNRLGCDRLNRLRHTTRHRLWQGFGAFGLGLGRFEGAWFWYA